jgi:hypothetical protein
MVDDSEMLFYRVLEEGGEFQHDIRDVRMGDGYGEVEGANALLIRKNLLCRRLISLLGSQEIR